MINITKNIRIPGNPYLLFLPFLLLYIVLVLILNTDSIWGDEGFYLLFSHNLIHGFYSPPAPNISLHYGPGYPIVLIPFVLLHAPFVVIKLMNAFFYYLSVIFLFKALKRIVSFRSAFIVSLFWACYYNSFDVMHRMHTEIFTSFLVALLILLLMKAFNSDKPVRGNKYIYLAGFIIGYLALTKLIFGYVLLFMLLGSGLLWLLNRKASNYRASVLILLVALATTAPYLIYTYRLTGRIFYWGTSGGNNLYWMSTPQENENGSWFPEPKSKSDSALSASGAPVTQRVYDIPGTEDSIRLYHQKDIDEANKYTGVARDDAYKKMAIKNIKAHPFKYIRNCFSNVARILFDYSYSYRLQRPGYLAKFPLNMIIVVFMLWCTIPTLLNWRKIIFPVRFILFFTFLYLGGSILGSAETRMFTVIVPLLLFWIAYIMKKSVKINLKFNENTGQ